MELIQSIVRIAIFLIFAQTIVHLSPRESYAKYMKLLVRLMLIESLLVPISTLLTGEPEELISQRLLQESRAYEQAIQQSFLLDEWNGYWQEMEEATR